ncbi:hypothetical protein HDU76_012203 [Blyttiomyces sp. JEL0837]|nr:hypothetical protein HDU76_012203 [Blyttiomyces sp. JEL0837]
MRTRKYVRSRESWNDDDVGKIGMATISNVEYYKDSSMSFIAERNVVVPLCKVKLSDEIRLDRKERLWIKQDEIVVSILDIEANGSLHGLLIKIDFILNIKINILECFEWCEKVTVDKIISLATVKELQTAAWTKYLTQLPFQADNPLYGLQITRLPLRFSPPLRLYNGALLNFQQHPRIFTINLSKITFDIQLNRSNISSGVAAIHKMDFITSTGISIDIVPVVVSKPIRGSIVNWKVFDGSRDRRRVHWIEEVLEAVAIEVDFGEEFLRLNPIEVWRGVGVAARVRVTQSLPTNPVVTSTEFADLRAKAQFARLAYCSGYPNFPTKNCNSCGGGFSKVVDIRPILSDDLNLQGYTAADPATSTIYVAFRGVVNNPNWLAVADVAFGVLTLPNSPANVKVEAGFFNSYKSIRSYVMGNVTALVRKYPGYKIHGVGHSFGCALSSFAVTDFALQKVLPASSISFTGYGCPRIGSYEYARLLDTGLGLAKTRRVVHSSDMIVHAPSAVGYRHFGDELWLDVATVKTYRCLDTNTNIDESKTCANSVPTTQWSWPAHNSYFSHGKATACAIPTAGVAYSEEYLRYVIYLPTD